MEMVKEIKNKLESDIIYWNNRFPLDRWWRKKYNIPYLSEEHRKSTFFTHLFEYFEDKMFDEHFKKLREQEQEENVIKDVYIPMSGNWWKGKETSQKEVDDWFKAPLI